MVVTRNSPKVRLSAFTKHLQSVYQRLEKGGKIGIATIKSNFSNLMVSKRKTTEYSHKEIARRDKQSTQQTEA